MKLRLLKVVVQPVFVLDDGDSLTEQTADPIVVPGGEWRSFADEGGGFDNAIAALRDRIEPSVEPEA